MYVYLFCVVKYNYSVTLDGKYASTKISIVVYVQLYEGQLAKPFHFACLLLEVLI